MIYDTPKDISSAAFQTISKQKKLRVTPSKKHTTPIKYNRMIGERTINSSLNSAIMKTQKKLSRTSTPNIQDTQRQHA